MPAARRIDEVNGDSGVYLFALELGGSRSITIGALGRIRFEKGWYLYVGSARRGLSARLARHERTGPGKAMKWHIDFLRAHARAVRSFPVPTRRDLECRLARDVQRLTAAPVPRFGSSDCACPSHLFRLAGDPRGDPRIAALLDRYRNRTASGDPVPQRQGG